MIDAAIQVGVLLKSGAFIKRGDKVLAQGSSQMAEVLRKDKKLKDELKKEIQDKLIAGKV